MRAARWAYWPTPEASGATNMALDEALRRYAAATGRTVLRVYGWSRPTVTVGRHERVKGRMAADRLAARGIDLVRRPTGGRALVHARSVTYAVAGPARPGESLRARYHDVNTVLVAALAALGAPARLATGVRDRPPGGSVCFAAPDPGEIVIGPGKLVGSAQIAAGGGWLQHGEILLHDDQGLLNELLLDAAAPSRVATLTEALGRTPTRDEVGAALAAAAGAEPFDDTARITREADPAPFAHPAWTWRR